MQHFSISNSAQDTAVHAVDLAICFQEGCIVTAGDEGLLFPHPGQQILLAAIIQLTEHVVQQEDGVLTGDGGSGGGFGHFQAEHHAALLPLAGKHSGGLAVQQQFQIFPVGAAQALPGPDFLILAGFEQGCQPPRLKLGGIPQLHPLRPMGKLLVIGTGQRSQPFQVGPPPLLDGFPLRGKLGVQHLEQGHFFGVGTFLPGRGAAQQRVFLLQGPQIAAVHGQVAGVELTEGGIQKFAPPLGCSLDQAQVAGVEHDSRKTAGKPYFDKITIHAGEAQLPDFGLPTLQEGITVKDVSFGYDEKKPILVHMNAEFKKGGKYALTGPSGCGKSTLLKILLGWLPGYQGKVLYDERDVRDYTPEQLQQKMSYIEQNVFLFNTTIRENITLGEHFTDEQMEKALRDSALAGDLANMPKGLDTPVGEEGNALSGGQKQRVAIARALIHNRSILLVDEGTSALDQKNADIVEKSLLSNPDLTLILISHHLSDERKAQFDHVYELTPASSIV